MQVTTSCQITCHFENWKSHQGGFTETYCKHSPWTSMNSWQYRTRQAVISMCYRFDSRLRPSARQAGDLQELWASVVSAMWHAVRSTSSYEKQRRNCSHKVCSELKAWFVWVRQKGKDGTWWYTQEIISSLNRLTRICASLTAQI